MSLTLLYILLALLSASLLWAGLGLIWTSKRVKTLEASSLTDGKKLANQQSILLNSMPVALFRLHEYKNGDVRMQGMNKLLEDIFGRNLQQLAGYEKTFLAHVHPEDKQKIALQMKVSSTLHKSFGLEFRFKAAQHNDYHFYFIYASPQLLSDGGTYAWQGYVIDRTDIRITEQKVEKIESLNRSTEGKLQNITQALPLMVFECQFEKGRPPAFTYISDYAQTLFPENITSENFWHRFIKLLHKDDLQKVHKIFKNCKIEDARFYWECRINNAQDEIRHMQIIATKDSRLENQWYGYLLDVTEQKNSQLRLIEAEKEAREAEGRIASVTNHLPCAIFEFRWQADKNFTTIYISEGAKDLIGYDLHAMQVDKNFWEKLVGQQHFRQFRKQLHLARENQTPVNAVFQITHANKQVRYLRVQSQVMWLDTKVCAYRGLAVDMTEAYQLEQENNAIKIRLEQATANVPGVLLTIRKERGKMFRLLYLSPACEKVLGYSHDWFNGKNQKRILSIFDLKNRKIIAHTLRVANTQGLPLSIKLELLKPDGQTVWLLVEGTINTEYRNVYQFNAYVSDTSEAHHLEQQKSLALKEAYAANQVKNIFLGNLSHEIRTPLNGILSLSEDVSKKTQDMATRNSADRIYRAGCDLLETVNQMLEYAKLEAEKIEIEQVSFRFSDLTQRMDDIFSTLADQKQIKFVTQLQPEADGPWLGDPTRLRQIFKNLLSNALKFTPTQGQVTLQIDLINAVEHYSMVQCKVTDTGMGMTREQMALLFKPFVQADVSVARQHGGTGLGLSICSDYVKLMGGDIAVNSEMGKGSCFSFYLPLKPSQDKPVEIQAEKQKAIKTPLVITRVNPLSADIKLLLDKLNIQLSEMDADVADTITVIHEKIYQTPIEAEFMPLIRAIENYDFALAKKEYNVVVNLPFFSYTEGAF